MRLALHYLAMVLAALSVIGFLWCRKVIVNSFKPGRSMDDRLTTALTPSARESDFIGNGWLAYKLQFVAGAAFLVMMFLYGITDSRS